MPTVNTTTKATIAAVLCAAGLTAAAQDASPERGLRIATGPKTGVYTQLARDIQKICGSVANLTPVATTGGLQNLMALSASEVDIGFAQLDLLQQLGKDGDHNIQDLQAIMPMHANLLHVITRKEGSKVGASTLNPFSGTIKVYRKFSELKEAQVALVGSAQLLGQSLEKQLAYGMRFIAAESDDQAITMLQSNQVQAVFTTGGWPYPAVSRHNSSSGLMLAEYDLPAQPPFAIVKHNYQSLGAYNLNFLAAPNLLVTRPFKPTGEKGKQVAALQSCIISHLDDLQEGDYNKVWQEIKNPTDTLGMVPFPRSPSAPKTKRG